MQYLLLENVTRRYGDKLLFENINLSISKGDKIALVAKNGTGKTTLLKIISGEEGSDGDTAKIEISKDIKISFLSQEPAFDGDDTVIEAIFDTDNEALIAISNYEKALISGDEQALQKNMIRIEDLKAWDLESRVNEVLTKLKLTDFDRKVKALSGGQKKRLALAKILIDEPDFLILDEPTNHLDIDMIEWLEEHLQQPNLTLFMVTHDRYFLERVCNTILEMDGGTLFAYRGNYSEYLEKRDARKINDAVNLEKTKKLFTKELEWMRRQPQARGTKAKSRIDNFYEIKEKAFSGHSDEDLKIDILPERLGSKILEAHSIVKKYDNKTIINSFSYKFKKGERVGIVGPNGAGKSTFLKVLTQEIPADSGKVVIGDTVVFGYYSQDGIKMNEDKMVIDVIRDIAEFIPLEKGKKMSAETLLERFLFPRPQQRVLVSQLSGGERRRLYLLTILMSNPNFLILDEPTNDLDIITLNVLENYLMDFPGCLLVVTHDRYFMDKLVDHIFVLEGDGNIQDFNGTYSEFQYRQKEEKIESHHESVAEKEVSSGKLSYEQRKVFARIEKEIEKLEKQKTELTERFEDTTLDHEEILKLSKNLDAINEELSDKEMQWLEMSEMM